MSCMDESERSEFIDLIAQAVVDKMEERARIEQLADLVVARVISMQDEESKSLQNTHAGLEGD